MGRKNQKRVAESLTFDTLGRVNRETSRFFDVPDAIFRNENSRGNQIRPYAGSKGRQNHNIDNIRFSR